MMVMLLMMAMVVLPLLEILLDKVPEKEEGGRS